MSEKGLWGWNNATDQTHEYNERAFMIAQALRGVNTATICKVQKCTVDSVVGPIGQVDILPLVDMIDGKGQTSHHQGVQKLPYLRMHSGTRAIIMDPKEGDIGLVVFADRDIQSVKGAKKQAPPGSRRHHNMADGMYVGTLIADAPTSYVRFDKDGTIIISPDNGTTIVTVKAGDVTVKVSNAVLSVHANIIGGTINGNMFVAANEGAKIKAGSDFLAVVPGSVLCSQPPVVGADPVPDAPTS